MLLHCRSEYASVSCASFRHALGSLTDPATDATISWESAGNCAFRSLGGTHMVTGDV